MDPPSRSESPSGPGGNRRRVVIDRIAYDVDLETFEVLCDNVYLDAVAARRIICRLLQSDEARTWAAVD